MGKAVNSPPGLFARPDEASRILLPMDPVLESWNAADHPDQRRLRDYLDGLLELIDLHALPPTDLLAFELVVGLPPTVAVDRGGRDLDNYLMPIARCIGAGRIAAAFGRKVLQPESTIAVGVARLRSAPSEPPDLRVHTTTSAQSAA